MVPTREHGLIKKWAQEYGALPAQIQRLKFDGEPAILTFTFGKANEAEPHIRPITWEAFFAQFDLLELSITFNERGPDFDIVKVEKPSASYPFTVLH